MTFSSQRSDIATAGTATFPVTIKSGPHMRNQNAERRISGSLNWPMKPAAQASVKAVQPAAGLRHQRRVHARRPALLGASPRRSRRSTRNSRPAPPGTKTSPSSMPTRPATTPATNVVCNCCARAVWWRSTTRCGAAAWRGPRKSPTQRRCSISTASCATTHASTCRC